MKLEPKYPAEEDQYAIKCSAALRKLANFCNSYKKEEIEDLSSSLLIALIGQNYSNYTNPTKERLLDYFEAMEEVLPALYELHDHIRSLSQADMNQLTYEQETAYRSFFSSLKPGKTWSIGFTL